MGLLDGELAGIVGTALVDAGLSKPGTLTKVTPTARDPAHPTTGTAPSTTSVTFQGLVASFTPYQIANTVITGATRLVKVFGSTLPSGVVPAPGDLITIEGLTSTIVNDDGAKKAVSRDAASAVYSCQCR